MNTPNQNHNPGWAESTVVDSIRLNADLIEKTNLLEMERRKNHALKVDLEEARTTRHNLELDVARLVRAINELTKIPSGGCCPDPSYKKVKGEWECQNCGETL